MKGTIFQQQRADYGLVLDPRTKLLLVITIPFILINGTSGGIMNIVKPILMFLPFILLFSSKRVKVALIYLFAVFLMYCADIYLVPITHGVVSFLLVASCGLISRFLPGLVMGYFLVSTTTVSEFTAAMLRMKVSEKIIIPMSVMFRFFPTVKEEYSAITDAMRMRGVSFAGGNPMAMLEYRLVPLMMSTVKIGDELSAAALTRGLGAPIRRTNICNIGFRIQDWIAITLCTACLIGFLVFSFSI